MTTDATLERVEAHAAPAAEGTAPNPPRLRFAVGAVAAYWLFWLLWNQSELVTVVRFFGRMLAVLLLSLTLAIWWLSRRSLCRRERWGIAGAFVAAAVAAVALSRETFGTFGLLLTALPWVFTAAVFWLLASRHVTARPRAAGLAATIVAAWSVFTLLRLDGLWADQQGQYHWRWAPSPEALYLAERKGASRAAPTAASSGGPPAAVTVPTTTAPTAIIPPGQAVGPSDSPAYLGAARDGVVRNLKLAADWDARPPRRLWRVGPAWSSFAAVGGRLYTQEQQGDAEAVVCLDADTGAEIWAHTDPARFHGSVAGTGPRGTPAYAGGRVYTLGGTGILNCLDAATGARAWSRNIVADAGGAPVPLWGFSASPLVTRGVVAVYAGGTGGKSLLAYHEADGTVAWTAAAGTMSYASPQPMNLFGSEQVVMLSERGVTAVDAATGAPLWEHPAVAPNAPRAVQPVLVNPSHVLFSSEADLGVALLDVGRDGSLAWTVHPRWASKALKPSFNHVVTHGGHAYGFDGSIFCCIDLGTGTRKWKSGRYGRGQVLLVEQSQHLLVLAEDGRAVLLRASPDKHEALCEFQALEGKTWNHPVLTRDRLYVRNAEEMACYELSASEN